MIREIGRYAGGGRRQDPPTKREEDAPHALGEVLDEARPVRAPDVPMRSLDRPLVGSEEVRELRRGERYAVRVGLRVETAEPGRDREVWRHVQGEEGAHARRSRTSG